MSVTKIVLDRQAKAKAFTFGDTSASGAAAVVVEKGTGATSATVFTVKATAQVDGDLVLGGNLVITGSINEQTVTNLNVTDKTITLNKGGAAASGGGSGFTVEENSANVAGLLYDSSLASKFKIGATGSEAEVVTVSGAQTLTNKTIAGSQISGNISGNAANVTGTVGIGDAQRAVDVGEACRRRIDQRARRAGQYAAPASAACQRPAAADPAAGCVNRYRNRHGPRL